MTYHKENDTFGIGHSESNQVSQIDQVHGLRLITQFLSTARIFERFTTWLSLKILCTDQRNLSFKVSHQDITGCKRILRRSPLKFILVWFYSCVNRIKKKGFYDDLPWNLYLGLILFMCVPVLVTNSMDDKLPSGDLIDEAKVLLAFDLAHS